MMPWAGRPWAVGEAAAASSSPVARGTCTRRCEPAVRRSWNPRACRSPSSPRLQSTHRASRRVTAWKARPRRAPKSVSNGAGQPFVSRPAVDELHGEGGADHVGVVQAASARAGRRCSFAPRARGTRAAWSRCALRHLKRRAAAPSVRRPAGSRRARSTRRRSRSSSIGELRAGAFASIQRARRSGSMGPYAIVVGRRHVRPKFRPRAQVLA